MAYVIAEPCLGCKDQACATVCPVDCIHGDTDSPQLYIDADECIHCGICQSACPVEAIFADDELPGIWQHFIQINADYYKAARAGTRSIL